MEIAYHGITGHEGIHTIVIVAQNTKTGHAEHVWLHAVSVEKQKGIRGVLSTPRWRGTGSRQKRRS